MIAALILACEIGFWVLGFTGLAARYLWAKPRLGLGLLVAIPVLDLVLLGAVAWQVHQGVTSGVMHVLAVIYLVVSLVYGHLILAWLDRKFAQRIHGTAPPKPLHGWDYALSCWKDLAWDVAAFGLATATVAVLGWFAQSGDQIQALSAAPNLFSIVMMIDFIWAATYSIWPKKP